MAERSGFFDAHATVDTDGSVVYDRTYLAESFAKYFASFIGNGVFGGKSDELMVQQNANASMNIRVLSGQGWINGYWYENDDELSLAIDVADGVLNRIDVVVLKWDNSERAVHLAIKKGTPAANASAPIIQRNADVYELKLAQIYVKAGATKITQADITDTRLDNEVCGFVHGVVEQFDTTEFGKQINSFIENFEASSIAEMQAVFDRVNSLLDEDVATKLVLDVSDALSEAALTTQTLGYSKKNLIPYPYKDTTKTVYGITFTDNGDGTVTANGTATSNASFKLYEGKIFANTILSGGKSVNERVQIVNVTNNVFNVLAHDTGAGVKVDTSTYDTGYIEIVIQSGATVSNSVFKPMLRNANIIDNTWELYTPSVAEMIQEDEQNMGCFYRINRQTGEKEWLNPPSAPGVEYSLTERWDNKPLYQMTLYAASLPNNSAMVLETNIGWDRLISVSGHAVDKDDLTLYPFPVILHNQITPIAIISRIESGGSLVVMTNGDVSHLEAYITVKYTKD